MKLREAGYREKAFAKSWLAYHLRFKDWPSILECFYSPERDRICYPPGTANLEVEWEGSRSREILAACGLDDKDCL